MSIQGKIYQMKNAANNENRFPRTVIEAVYGLSSYLQQQFASLADIYMPIEGISEALTGQEFVYRISPQTIKSKALTLDRIKGKTLAWNQLVRHTTPIVNGDTANVTCTRETDGRYKIVVAATVSQLTNIYFAETIENGYIANHKYYCTYGASANLLEYVGYNSGNGFWWQDTPTGYIGMAKGMRTFTDSRTMQNTFYLGTAVPAGTYYVSPLRFDLTLMFGVGNEPTTVAEFEALYPLPYYAYNAGELINNGASGLETVGFNQWDEEWENGYIDVNGVNQNSSTSIRSKNYNSCFPSTSYYAKKSTGINYVGIAWYDINKTFIQRDASNNANPITSPSNAAYFRVSLIDYGTTYNHDICINISDTDKNGTYEPYRKTVLPLDLKNLKVKSPNIWDEEWELGGIDENGVPVGSSISIRSKNYIAAFGNTAYRITCKSTSTNQIVVYFYDANKVCIPYTGPDAYANGYNGGSGLFTTPVGTAFMLFRCTSIYGTTYNNDICINLSNPGHNGKYYPHGSFNPFPDGLRSAGTAYDEIVGNKVVRRMGSVDLGALNYIAMPLSSGGHAFSSTTSDGLNPKQSGSYDSAPCVSSKYVSSAQVAESRMSDKTIGVGKWSNNSGNVHIIDSGYSNSSSANLEAFKTAMSGVYLYYELATPEEFVLETPLVLTTTAGTTERRLPEDTASSVLAPFACDMTYGTNPSEMAGSAGYSLYAGKLLNARKIWGQDFDGTADVTGNLTTSGTVTAGAVNTGTLATSGVSTFGATVNLNSGAVIPAGQQLRIGVANIAYSSSAVAIDRGISVSGNIATTGNVCIEPNKLLYLDYGHEDSYISCSNSPWQINYVSNDGSGTHAFSGGITCDSFITAGAAASSSDKALKEGITPISAERALSVISALKPSEWVWNDKNAYLAGKHGAGLVAQEVKSVLPDAVVENGSDYLALNYNMLHAYEIKAIQNLNERVKALEK